MMKSKLADLSRKYQAALRKHLKRGAASLQPAKGLGRRAMAIGLETLDLAKIHERALIQLVLPKHSPGKQQAMLRRAGAFIAEAIIPIEKTHRIALETNTHLAELTHRLRKHSAALAASNRKLKEEVIQRRSAEE